MTGKVMPDDIYHGGDLDRARARWGEPDGGWLDLSTGINPEPYPVDGAEGADFASLPQPVACEKLMAAAAAYYGVPDPALVVPAPGTQAVIQWLPRLCPPGPVAITGPTYGGYMEPWRAAGHAVTMALDLAHAAENAATVILANPNNPDGRRVQAVNLCFEAVAGEKGEPTTPEETLAVGFFAPGELPEPFVPPHEIRIADVVDREVAARVR